jgi:hypothetical protein
LAESSGVFCCCLSLSYPVPLEAI